MIFLLSVIGLALLVYLGLSLFASKESRLARLFIVTARGRWAAAVFGLVLAFAAQWIMHVDRGRQHYVIGPFGAKSTYFSAGYKVIAPFSRVQEWEKFVDVQVIPQDENGNLIQSTEGIEGVISDQVLFTKTLNLGKTNESDVEVPYYGIPITFNDKVRAVVLGSFRFKMPSTHENFIALAEEFRSPENLVRNTLVPTVKEQVGNNAWIFSAEDYTSGDAANFRNSLDDQLKNGGFLVNKTETYDTIYSNLDVTGNIVGKTRQISEIKESYEVEIVEDPNTGMPIRVEHDITKNNIEVSQVIISSVEVEPKFRQKLELQRDIAAQKGVEIMKQNLAKDAQARIVAEGERDKAQERVNQEKEQVSKLIAIETQVKEEESKRQLAEIALQTERLDAQKRRVAADAKKYEIIQADDISAEKKFIIEQSTRQVELVSEAMKTFKLPTYYVSGGENGQANDEVGQYIQLMTMQLMKSQEMMEKAVKGN